MSLSTLRNWLTFTAYNINRKIIWDWSRHTRGVHFIAALLMEPQKPYKRGSEIPKNKYDSFTPIPAQRSGQLLRIVRPFLSVWLTEIGLRRHRKWKQLYYVSLWQIDCYIKPSIFAKCSQFSHSKGILDVGFLCQLSFYASLARTVA